MIRDAEQQREAERIARKALAEALKPKKAALKAQRKLRQKDVRRRDRGLGADERQRQPRQFDQSYSAWLHGLPCIACLIEGRAPPEHRHIEAAHQKIGRQKALGRRPSDGLQVPLCAWDHRLAPDCCDPAQAKFWARLGIDPLDYCNALYAAFKADEPGEPVVRSFASPTPEKAANHG